MYRLLHYRDYSPKRMHGEFGPAQPFRVDRSGQAAPGSRHAQVSHSC